jgi:hypothetical protein
MNLDIRWPMGALFVLFGLLIGGYGALGLAAPIGDLNVNLLWGVVLLAFGLLMLWLARRGRQSV